MDIIKKLLNKDISHLTEREKKIFLVEFDVENLITQYNRQTVVAPVSQHEITEYRNFMLAYECPPVLLYEIAGIPRNMPIKAYDFSFADLDCEFVREKGEVVQTLFRAKDGRPVVRKERVYTYSEDLVPLTKTTTIVWFYGDGTEGFRFVKTIPLNDKGRAKSLRFGRLSQNLIDVNDWLRDQGLKNADFKKLSAAMSPYLELYRNGITAELIAAVLSDTLSIPETVRSELAAKLTV